MVRGDVYRLRPSNGAGHEQRGERYGVVVQSDAFLPRSVVVIAPGFGVQGPFGLIQLCGGPVRPI
ncbi:MAG: type II toxin-antitoxin system PemK/MazF family toxin [Acidimicrobiales bacterium]